MATGSGGTSGAARRIQWLAVAALACAAASLLVPGAIGVLVLSGAAIVLGVLARRQLRRDPTAGSSWVSIAALIVGGFVLVSQLVILAIASF